MYNQKLNGMTAVITGGNGVIGGVFARALAGEGADIAIICRNTGSAERHAALQRRNSYPVWTY